MRKSCEKLLFTDQGYVFFLLLDNNCDIMIKNVPLLMENSQNAPKKQAVYGFYDIGQLTFVYGDAAEGDMCVL